MTTEKTLPKVILDGFENSVDDVDNVVSIMSVTVMIMKVESLENNKTLFSEKVMNSDKMLITKKEKLLSDGMSFAEVINNYSVDVTERSFSPLSLSFLESDFALLWYKTLYSEVAWTEENAGKSEFALLQPGK